MNADELDAAREAVAASKAWRDQMRADWGYHREPEEVLDEAVGELLAENQRLRTGIMTAEVHGGLIVRMRESVWQEFVADRDRLRAVVDAADDFWPLIESIYDAALATWEYDDQRMKYVTVQISKVDLPTLLAAYASPIGEDT